MSFQFSVFRFPFISYPLPLRVLPLSQGEKVIGHLKPESTPTNFVPLSQGEKVRGHLKRETRHQTPDT